MTEVSIYSSTILHMYNYSGHTHSTFSYPFMRLYQLLFLPTSPSHYGLFVLRLTQFNQEALHTDIGMALSTGVPATCQWLNHWRHNSPSLSSHRLPIGAPSAGAGLVRHSPIHDWVSTDPVLSRQPQWLQVPECSDHGVCVQKTVMALLPNLGLLDSFYSIFLERQFILIASGRVTELHSPLWSWGHVRKLRK